MTWREQLRPASWRGIPFLVKTVEAKPGRRVVLHEYPGRDFADWEDLGKMPKRFRLEAFFIGNDYLNNRNRLLREIDETAGPGVLILPTHGQYSCVCREPESNWSDQEGGIEYLTLSFVQVGQFAATVPVADPTSQLQAATGQAVAPVVSAVGNALKVAGQPSFVQVGTLARAQAALDTVRASFARVQLATDTARQFAGRIQAIERQGLTLLAQPATYARSVLGLFSGVGDGLTGDFRALFATYTSLFDALGFTPDPPVFATLAQQALAANQVALAQLAQTAVLLAAAEIVPEIEWPARSDAIADRDALAARADALAEGLSNGFQDEWLAALQPVHVLANRVITDEARTLQDYRTIRLFQSVPALALAYELYGDAFRADEIVDENQVRHPGFLPVDTALQVLEA